MLYRVRKSWEDSKSQLGAYNILVNAVNKANENPGYSVYDEQGNVVYAPNESVEVLTMGFKATLKRKINAIHPKGQSVVVNRNYLGQWILIDGTIVPNKSGYLDLKAPIYNPNAVYTKAQAEQWVNSIGIASETEWLFWCNKYGQHVYIFKATKNNTWWELQKCYMCGTGNIANGDGSDTNIGFGYRIWDKNKAFKGPHSMQYYNQHFSSKNGNSIHQGKVGAPSTHGCIALSNQAAVWVFNTIPIGSRVIVW